jgi:arylsulfatase A-like enzyme
MREFLRYCGQILPRCLPQLALSLGAILAYQKALIFPGSSVGTHLAMIVLLHVAFFSMWAVLAQRWQGAEKPWFRRLYAASCVAKGLMLNAVYLASYMSYRLWGSYISWANLKAIGPHLHGFYLALGWPVFVGLALGALLFAVHFLLALRFAQPALARLATVGAGPGAIGRTLALAAMVTVIGGSLWLQDPEGGKANELDPVLAFWTNQADREPNLTPDMLADRADGLAYKVPAEFRRRNVIVIAVDCLRDDHLSFRGYPRETTPFLDSLARAGQLHQVGFAVSNGNDSPQGIRAILGARYPHHHNMHNFRLQDLLKRAGYRTHVIGAGDHTTFGNLRKHYGPNVDVFRDGLVHPSYSINDDRGLVESLTALPAAGKQPAFFYFHLMSAHTLGLREPAFTRWEPALVTIPWADMVMGRINREVMTNTYDNGVRQADHYLEQIFAQLKAKGYLEDYVAVITGDHGEGLGERGVYGHTRYLFAEDINIPILFLESTPADYGPMPFGSHVDIAATLLARLGLPLPSRWSGRSLYQSPPPERTYSVSTRASGGHAILLRRDGRLFKYLFVGRSLRAFQEHLYDEITDPGERQNLVNDPAYAQLRLELRHLAATEFNEIVPPTN